MMAYSDLLRDPRWQRRRLEIMQRADFACEICGDDRTTLNVHHLRYVRGRMPWEYEDADLRCLCEPCHARQHPDKVAPPMARMNTILPNALLDAAERDGHSPEWRAILKQFGVLDRYNPAICIVCYASYRTSLTRCDDCAA